MTIEDTLRQIVREEIAGALANYRPPAIPATSTREPAPFILNVKTAAEYLGIHENTIRIALEDGTLHGFQRSKGGRWHIRRECLEAWIGGERCEHQTSPGVTSRRYP
jgi:excisionase family DNA binding protein